MNEILKKLVRFVLSFIPTAVPVGVTEFNTWADSIVALSGLPNNASMKFTLASMVLYQLKPTEAYISKHHMVKVLRKAAANQVASYLFQELKSQQGMLTANESIQSGS